VSTHQILPNVCGGFAYTLTRHEVARHCSKQVVVRVHGLKPIGVELAFHRQRRHQFLSHQP
jgi:hypothetical protein